MVEDAQPLGAHGQFSGNRTTPAFAAAKYSNGYHGAFLASTATLVPLPHPDPDQAVRQAVGGSRRLGEGQRTPASEGELRSRALPRPVVQEIMNRIAPPSKRNPRQPQSSRTAHG